MLVSGLCRYLFTTKHEHVGCVAVIVSTKPIQETVRGGYTRNFIRPHTRNMLWLDFSIFGLFTCFSPLCQSSGRYFVYQKYQNWYVQLTGAVTQEVLSIESQEIVFTKYRYVQILVSSLCRYLFTTKHEHVGGVAVSVSMKHFQETDRAGYTRNFIQPYARNMLWSDFSILGLFTWFSPLCESSGRYFV